MLYTNPEDLLKALNLADSEWYGNGDNHCHWIFRGQTNSFSPLQPSISRGNTYNEIFDIVQPTLIRGVPDLKSTINNLVNGAMVNSNEIYRHRLKEIIKKIFVEITLIEEFSLQANQLGFSVPTLKLFPKQFSEISSMNYFYNNLDHYINKFVWVDRDKTSLYETFPPSELNFFPYKGFIDFAYPEANALAQHHGIPTRYLDWTKNPYFAAFFAAQGSKTGDTICIWALNTRYLYSTLQRGPIRLHKKLPHTGLEFLHHQKGLFTEMIGAEGYYYHNDKWPNLNEYLEVSSPPEGFLKQFELKIEDPQFILGRLNNMDINKYNLMPTYDHIALDIINRYKSS